MEIFQQIESSVRSYCRSFPVVFSQAREASLFTTDGTRYIDFLAGAGTLNYGHNNPVLKAALLEYIQQDGITHGLDMYTEAKEAFLNALQSHILEPRDMDYKVMFTGPTGTNAVEAALKIARKKTGRTDILSFTNGFHGCTLGALAITGNASKRSGAGIPAVGVQRVPFEGYYGKDVDTLAMIDKLLTDPSSGYDKPAAVIFEPIQGEGGLNAASIEWMQGLEKLCRKHDILLIADDIQSGNGRSGDFFAFEAAGISPDMITCSKSLSGYGLPFAIMLLKPELDIFSPGEHNGTFRGNNLAFVTATKTIEHYWADDRFINAVRAKCDILENRLQAIIDTDTDKMHMKGRGFMRGIEMPNGEIAAEICAECFENNLVIETSGSDDQVVKCLIPLVIGEDDLNEGLDVLEAAVKKVLGSKKHFDA